MKKIICKINLFNFTQDILLVDNNNVVQNIGSENIETLGDYIAQACGRHKVSRVSLFGDEEYLSKIVDSIKESPFNEDLNIKIEVNNQ